MRSFTTTTAVVSALAAAAPAHAVLLDFAGLTPGATFTSATYAGFTAASLAGQAYSTPCGVGQTCSNTGGAVSVGGTAGDPLLSFGTGPRAIAVTGQGLFTLGAFIFSRTGAIDNLAQVFNVIGYRNGQIMFQRTYAPPVNAVGVVSTPLDGYQSIQVDRVLFASESFHNGVTLDSINLDAVPEPASWALMLIGFGLLGGALRRRSAVRAVAA